ncbi:MAG: carbohydrate-binding protein [Victivallales bacterium]|nr:carbohydrate-binding protein [Victivallales bacterium]
MNRIKERMMAGLLASTILAGAILAGGTQLTHEGKTIFESEAKVSFGATYGERAVKAVVNAKEPCKISVRTDRKPTYVFVNRELMDAAKWSYSDDTKMTALQVPAGSANVQFRFDGMASLKPVDVTLKMEVALAANGGPLSLDVKGVNVDEKFSGKVVWPKDQAGLYEIAADGCAIKTMNASAVDGRTYFMGDNSALQIDAEAPGGVMPMLKVSAKFVGAVAKVKAQDRVKLLERKDVVKIEAESYNRISGGEVSISKEHQNTSEGGCIFAWGTAGTRLEWDVDIPADGKYHVAFVMASQETVALRKFMVNDKSVAAAALIGFDGTGGWGRSNPKEWKACEAVGADGKPVTVELKAGKNTLSLENFSGQHLNLDCIVIYK